MRWEDERYVRLYTRDTAEFLALSLEAQGLLSLILRKVDRAGILPLGRLGKRGVAVAINHPARWEPTIRNALEELLVDGCVVVNEDRLVVRNFVQAQEASSSGRARAAAYRERLRAGVSARTGDGVTSSNETSPANKPSQFVAGGDAALPDATVRDKNVTPSRTVPSVPSVPEEAARATTPPAPADHELVSYLQRTWPDISDPEATAAAWRDAFPGLDLLAQAKAARAYEVANGDRKRGGVPPAAFLNRWFARELREPPVGTGFQRKENGNAGDNGAARAKAEIERTSRMLDELRNKPRAPPGAIAALGRKPAERKA